MSNMKHLVFIMINMVVAMTDDETWKQAVFRQHIVQRIEQEILQSRISNCGNSRDMENHIFERAKNKEEYLAFTARLILYIREMKRSVSCPNNQHKRWNNIINLKPNGEKKHVEYNHQICLSHEEE